MFKNAIVRRPCAELIHGITTANLGQPDYKKALQQHIQYINALEKCGLSVHVLEANSHFPDSTFVEDVVIHTPECMVVTRPGAASRREEIELIIPLLKKEFKQLAFIKKPATLEGGDVMQIGDTFYVGLSKRTNQEGATQLAHILKQQHFKVITVLVQDILHLKTGMTYLDNNRILLSGEFIEHPAFDDFEKIIVAEEEAYAANLLYLNGTVVIPSGFPKTKAQLKALDYPVLEVDMSEFQKIDGGLTCLSVRY